MGRVILTEGDQARFACQRCGQIESLAFGTVDEDGEPAGAYAVSWGEAEMLVAVTLGPWGVDDHDERRVGVFALRVEDGVVQMRLSDARGRHFYPALLGRPLSRLELALDPRRRRYWRLVEAVLSDRRVEEGLRGLIDRWAYGLS